MPPYTFGISRFPSLCAFALAAEPPSRRIRLKMCAAALLSLAAVVDGQVARLVQGQIVEKPLAGGETHTYALSLTRNQFVELRVAQAGIDVVLEIVRPDGRSGVRMDSSVGSSGEERACWIAGETGIYSIRVAAFDPGVVPGRYEVEIRQSRASTRMDRTAVKAQSLYLEAGRLERLQDAASRRAAAESFGKAASLWRSIGDRRQEALTLFELGVLRRGLGDFRQAEGFLRSASEAARVAQDRQLDAKALDSLGNTLVFSGELDSAVNALGQALALSRLVKDRQAEADCLRHRGEAFWRQGQYQKALDDYEPALAIAIALKDRRSQAWAWNALGLAYASMGEARKALDRFERAVPLSRAVSDASTEAFSLQNMGYAYWRLGAYRRALESFQAVLPGRRAAGERQQVALLINNIGLAQLSLGEASLARSNFEEALSIWTRIGDARGRVLALLNLGQASEALKERQRAAGFWRQARDEAAGLGLRDHRSAALSFLAGVDADRGDLDRARSEIAEAVGIVEGARGEILATPLRASFLSSKQNVYGVQVDVLLRLLARYPVGGFDAEAFQASERGRARALAESLAESRLDLTPDLPEDLQRRERDLSGRLAALERDNRAGDSFGAAEEEWISLIGEIRKRSPRYASVAFPETATLASTQRALDARTALICFSILAREVVAFVVTRDGLAVRRLATSPPEAAERVADYVSLVSRDQAGRWDSLSERLHTDLVASWLAAVPAAVKRLVIVPEGFLYSLPFEALRDPRTHRPILEDFSISYVPSATFLREVRKPEAAAPGPAAIFALSDTGEATRGSVRDALSPLPFAAEEARAVVRFGGPGSVLETTTAEGSPVATRIARFPVLHFATHARLDDRAPLRSGLVFSDGGERATLTAREIYRLRLRSNLVVLSSCESARGRILPGEGVQGLSQAFFYAGARTVVASLWEVSDRRTAELMKSFYGYLSSGRSKAEALTWAKRDLLRREPGLAPRYWSPFVLIGEPEGRVPLVRPYPWGGLPASLIGAAAGAIVFAIVVARRRHRIEKGYGPSRRSSSGPSTPTVQK